jgi:cytoskeletal protein CcmA (bactofilin family)
MTKQTLVIDDEQVVSAQTNANVLVRSGGRLTQRGQLNGDAVIESGGILEQRGQLNGDIHAHGAVVLWGQVNGDLHVYPGSDVVIAEGVMLAGKQSHRYLAANGTLRLVPKGEAFSTSVGPTMWRLAPDGRLSRA